MIVQIRRNTNYVLNESENMKFIDQKVSEILEEPVNNMPHNFVSLFNAQSMPQINHCVLNLPGHFRRLEATMGFTWNGENIYLDQLTTANYLKPSFYPFVGINTEYFIGRLQKKDKKRLLKYSLNSSCKLHVPCFTIAAINYEPQTLEEIAYVDDHPININYRPFTKERLYKSLNRMNKIDYFKQPMSGLDYGEWAQGIAFASNKYAKDYIRKSVNLFTSIEKINETYQMNLFLSLKEMIKYYFKNKEEKMELLTMITKSVVYPEVRDGETFQRMVAQKDRQIKEIIRDKDFAIANWDSVIADKDVTIARLTSELNSLKKNNVI